MMNSSRELFLIFLLFFSLPSWAQVTTKLKEIYYSGTDLTLKGKKLTNKNNPFTAYLLTKDQQRFELEYEEINNRGKAQIMSVSLPFIENPGFFDLCVYGGNVTEDDPQVFNVLLGINPDDNGAESSYWIEDDYEAGLLEYSLSSEGSIESLKGETGDQGPIGEKGPSGDAGAAGSDTVASLASNLTDATSFSSLVTLNATVKIPSNAGADKILVSNSLGSATWQDKPSPGVSSLNEMPDAAISGASVFIGEGLSTALNNAEDNIIIGYEAGNGLTTADRNIAVGYKAMYAHQSGFSSVAVGYKSSEKSIDDAYAVSIGALSVANAQHDSYSTALGKSALYNYADVYALGIGVEAAYSYSSSSYLAAVGNSAFRTITSNNYGVAIGNNAARDVGNINGITVLGHNSGMTASNLGQTVIGNDNSLPGGAGNYYTDIADLLYVNNAKIGINESTTVRELNISDVMRLEPRSSAPSSPVLGDLYVDSDTDELCFYDGSSWYGIRASQACS